MSSKLFILTGASGSGKTTLLNKLINDLDFNIIKAPKYSTRKERDKDDDIIYSESINRENFDLVYKLNNKNYGIKISEIKTLLNHDRNLVIILSDIRVIKELIKELKDSVVTLFISSEINENTLDGIQKNRNKGKFKLSEQDSNKLYKQYLKLKSAINLKDWNRLFEFMGELIIDWGKYIPDKDSTNIRKSKIRDFHKLYIDNINLFHHVILNHTKNKPDEMVLQVENLLTYYKNKKINTVKEKPIIFIVSASSGSGKGMLMESIRDVFADDEIKITTKIAKRYPKQSDRRDGMIAIGENEDIDSKYDLRWTFHKGEFHNGTEYAVSEKEIKDNIKLGIPQIFISNIKQIDMFKKILDKNVVFLYLHTTLTDEEIKDFQYQNCKTDEEAKQRIKEIADVHDSYIKNISKINHVLLNTAYPEDLYEQIFKLIEYYEN